jgi:hypothetical protein
MDSYPMWIVRYTNVILVCWFLCVSLGLGLWVVKPTFDQYVGRLIEERQLIFEMSRAQTLREERNRLKAKLSEFKSAILPLDAMTLANQFNQRGDVMQVKASVDRWTFHVDVTGQPNPFDFYGLLGQVSGLLIETIEFQSADQRTTVRLSLRPEKAVRWHIHASQTVNTPAGLQFGQIAECPSPVLKAQFGDRLLVEMGSSQIQHARAGDWIDGDWRLLAYRDQRFIFKNSLGRTCVQKSL